MASSLLPKFVRYHLMQLLYVCCLVLNLLIPSTVVYLPFRHPNRMKQEDQDQNEPTCEDIGEMKKRIHKVLMGSHRNIAVSLAFRLIMGVGYYTEGFLLSTVRTKRMQMCKRDIILAMKQRIAKNTRRSTCIHNRLDVDWESLGAERGRVSLTALNLKVTHHVVKQLLDLPDDLNMERIRQVGNVDTEKLLNKGLFFALQCLVGLQNVGDPQLEDGQDYLRNFVYAHAWDKDSFCQDVIDIGIKYKVDSHGVLAELLSGMSANITKVFSLLLWHSVHGEDCMKLKAELEAACRQCKDLTDEEVVNLHRKIENPEAVRGRQLIHKWVSWVLQSYPNLREVVRQDLRTGEARVVRLTTVASKTKSADHVFAAGPLGCPGQSLARTTMLLAIRCYFAPDNKFSLVAKPSGMLKTYYHNMVGELAVEWTDDAVQYTVKHKKPEKAVVLEDPSETEVDVENDDEDVLFAAAKKTAPLIVQRHFQPSYAAHNLLAFAPRVIIAQ